MPAPQGRKYGVCLICGTRTMRRYMPENRTLGLQSKCMNPGHWWNARKARRAAAKKRWRNFRKKK